MLTAAMNRLLPSILVFLCLGLLAEGFPRAQWIHYPEPDAEGLHKNRYFWTDVDVPPDADAVQVAFHLDDGGDLLIDGKAVAAGALKKSPPDGSTKIPAAIFDGFSHLTPGGRHRLEFRDVNAAGMGGIICRITFLAQGEPVREFLSDDTWRTAKKPSLEGGEAEAVAAAVHCDLLGLPFSSHFAPSPLYCAAERRAIETAAADKAMRYQAFQRDVLANEEEAVARVVYENQQPMISINGSLYPPILYCVHDYQDFLSDKFTRSMENFRDAGLHLYVMGVPLGPVWQGPGQYAFDSIDAWMEDALMLDPDAHVMFAITAVGAPGWWLKEHPEECVEYLNDELPVTTNEQLASRFVAPSFASGQYLDDMKQFMKALVEYVDSRPWGKRIFAFRNDNGVYLEWHHWGMANALPDVSRPMQRHFRKFLKERYGTDEALQAAWGDPAVTIETATLANKEERLAMHAGNLLDPVKDARAIDSVRCVMDAVADFLLNTNHTIKEACGRRRLVGNFYGYFFGMGFPAVGWQLELERILQSPDVDFNCQPPPYHPLVRDFGNGQFSRGLVSSYRLHGKLNIIEADTRTCDMPITDEHSYSTTPAESAQLLARDFCQALCSNLGMWYFDFGGGWYTWPVIRDFLAKIRPVWEDRTADNSSAAEVLLVGDMESVYHQINDDLSNTVQTFIDNNRMELGHAGVPFDTILLQDLENPALRTDYKVYVFLNAILETPERDAIAERLRSQGKTIVWLDKAGYLHPGQVADNAEKTNPLTGFKVKCMADEFTPELVGRDGVARRGTFHTPSSARPLMAILDADAELLGTTAGQPTFARKKNPAGGYSYLATVPFLKARDYMEIFREAGVHVYCEDEDVAIYANKSYLMVHTGKAGKRRVSLPRPCKLVQILPEKRLLSESTQEFILDADAKTTYLLRME